ncbi:MAG TPA: ribosome-associated translation inhibitor RaiA [Thermoanaerobaculia bacterium]|nr:ribosome-associated translation inhibitor RaiA [Thermoanaerobaculia bacterium]
MNIEISGRNYEVPDRIRELILKRLDKVTRFFEDVIEIRCVLNVEKHRNICEMIIIGKNQDVKSIQEADTMEDAITTTIDHLKTQATKNRKKITDHRKKGSTQPAGRTAGSGERSDRSSTDRKTAPRIIRQTALPIRPMSVEQAAITLDDSRNEFIVFRDLDTDKVTVIYRRRDNDFGLIAPEF